MANTIQYRELKRRYDLDGAKATVKHLSEAIKAKQLTVEDFSIRDLAEALVPDGREWVRSLDPRNASPIVEDGVDSTAFSNITGQLLISKVMDAYQSEQFVLSGLIPSTPTRLNGEKIPGIARVGDKGEVVAEGMPYPNVGFGEDYIETPSTVKYGLIIPVTKEAIFFDRTNLITSRAAEVGEILGIAKEKRLLDLLVGSVNNYKWKGTTYDTYSIDGTTGAAGGTAWGGINSVSGAELIDWTDVDTVEQLFVDLTDPNTGEPILVSAMQVLVMPAYRHAAQRIFNATEIRYTGSTAPTQTLAPNPLSGYSWYESRLAQSRIVAGGETAANAKKWWFMGNFAKAFAYMENWPITVTQAPSNNEAEFTQDIVLRFKASERGVAAVIDPRYVAKAYQA